MKSPLKPLRLEHASGAKWQKIVQIHRDKTWQTNAKTFTVHYKELLQTQSTTKNTATRIVFKQNFPGIYQLEEKKNAHDAALNVTDSPEKKNSLASLTCSWCKKDVKWNGEWLVVGDCLQYTMLCHHLQNARLLKCSEDWRLKQPAQVLLPLQNNEQFACRRTKHLNNNLVTSHLDRLHQ